MNHITIIVFFRCSRLVELKDPHSTIKQNFFYPYFIYLFIFLLCFILCRGSWPSGKGPSTHLTQQLRTKLKDYQNLHTLKLYENKLS